jgi:hypothetical protein
MSKTKNHKKHKTTMSQKAQNQKTHQKHKTTCHKKTRKGTTTLIATLSGFVAEKN